MSRIIATLTGEGFRSDIIEDDDGRVHFKGDLDIDADGLRPCRIAMEQAPGIIPVLNETPAVIHGRPAFARRASSAFVNSTPR